MFEQLIIWSQDQFNHLPWRQKRTLYSTLVSEVMLQQTTVSTVEKHYSLFLDKFPTPQALAGLNEEDILVAWKGLGYYRRAKNLHKTCQDIVRDFAGKFPEEREQLLGLRGIGPYTASALVAIGLNRPELAIDANLERVLARIYGLSEKSGTALHKKLRQLFFQKKILNGMEKWGPRAIHEALMDLGRIHCQANRVNCPLCPMKRNCLAFRSTKPLSFPLKSITPKTVFENVDLLRLVIRHQGHILVYTKKENEWLHGQVEIPTFELGDNQIVQNQYPPLTFELSECKQLQSYPTSITKYRFKNYVCVTTQQELKKMSIKSSRYQWRNEKEIRPHLSTASLKALKLISSGLNKDNS